MDLKNILEQLDPSVISEESVKEIAEAFETAVNEKVESRLNLHLENALSKQDEDHAEKLTKLLEAIDNDHSDKLQKVVSAINENHTDKLNEIVSFYKKALNENAKTFSDKIVSEISSYLDLYLEKTVPADQLNTAVKNVAAQKQLNEIRKIVGIDKSFVTSEIKNTISEGKNIINDLKLQLEETKNENQKLQEKVLKIETNMILEERTRTMAKSKRDYVFKLLGDKDKNYINENFNYVVEMFESGQEEEKAKLAQDAIQKAVSLDAKPTATPVISESTSTPNGIQSPVGGYLSELKKKF
jgi:hypothetical protein